MPTTTEALLDELLSEDIAELRRREEAIIAQVPDLNDGVVLYGAGELGRRTLAGLTAAGVSVLAFADRNPRLWGRTLDDTPVGPLGEVLRAHGEATPIIVTIFTAAETRQRFLRDGLRVVSSMAAFLKYSSSLLPFQALDFPHKVADHAPDIRRCFSLWDDEASRSEFVAQVGFRLRFEDRLPPALEPGSIYFPEEIAPLGDDECFVDCGAFDGDSIRSFLGRRGPAFRRIIALEPDPASSANLLRFIESLDPNLGVGPRFRLIAKAASSARQIVRFQATGTVASHASAGGALEVECAPLDELLADERPTYIKMDIEGAEPDAIEGARSTIASHRPALAICLYHRQEHLWQIPLLVDDLGQDYRFFLRRYSDDCWEQILYAIPGERLAS